MRRHATTSASRTRHTLLFRVLLAMAAVALAVEFLYVAAANAVFAFGAIPKLFSGTDSVKVEARSGWTLLPGRVHVRDLRMTIQDRNMQSEVDIAEVFVVLRLRDLAHHVFHATKLRASGVAFRFRNRVEPEHQTRPEVRALPPIHGFSDPPLYEPKPPEGAQSQLWTVHLEDVIADARELWVEQFRFVGHARARGAFRLVPTRELWVGPATLNVDPGQMFVDGRGTLRGFSGSIDCTVHRFDVKGPSGLEVLRNISAKLSLGGTVEDAAAVALFLSAEGEPTTVTQTNGRLSIDVKASRGVVADDSRVELLGDSFSVERGSKRFEGSETWSILGKARSAKWTVVASVRHGALVEKGARATVDGATVSVTSNTTDTAVPWELDGAEAQVERMHTADLRLLNGVLGSRVRFERGEADGSGFFSESGGAVVFLGDASVKHAALRVGTTGVAGSFAMHATSSDFDATRDNGTVEASFTGSALSVWDESKDRGCRRGDVDGLSGSGRVEMRQRRLFRGTFGLSATGVRGRSGGARLSTNARVDVTLARLESRQGSRVSAKIVARELVLAGVKGGPQSWSARAPKLEVGADFESTASPASGSVRANALGASVMVGDVSLRGDVSAAVDARDIEPSERSAAIAGTVRLDRAILWSAGRRVEGWWAELGLESTRVDARHQLEFGGRVDARFRDGRPAMLVLSHAHEIPGFIPSLLPLNELSGTFDVMKKCGLIDISAPRIEGGPLTAQGQLQRESGETKGAILVRVTSARGLSAGIAFAGGDQTVSLSSDDAWLGERLEPLKESVRAQSGRACAPPPSSPPSSCD